MIKISILIIITIATILSLITITEAPSSSFAAEYNKESCQDFYGEWEDRECKFRNGDWEANEDFFYKAVCKGDDSEKCEKHRLSIQDGDD
jgi:hypothetical protein